MMILLVTDPKLSRQGFKQEGKELKLGELVGLRWSTLLLTGFLQVIL